MTSHSESPLSLLEPARLVPLIAIERLEDAVPLARTLVDAGLPTMEIALRNKVAPHAIREIRAHVPDAIPAAGNVMTLDAIEHPVMVFTSVVFSVRFRNEPVVEVPPAVPLA